MKKCKVITKSKRECGYNANMGKYCAMHYNLKKKQNEKKTNKIKTKDNNHTIGEKSRV